MVIYILLVLQMIVSYLPIYLVTIFWKAFRNKKNSLRSLAYLFCKAETKTIDTGLVGSFCLDKVLAFKVCENWKIVKFTYRTVTVIADSLPRKKGNVWVFFYICVLMKFIYLISIKITNYFQESQAILSFNTSISPSS